jgi:hypothetical protein
MTEAAPWSKKKSDANNCFDSVKSLDGRKKCDKGWIQFRAITSAPKQRQPGPQVPGTR